MPFIGQSLETPLVTLLQHTHATLLSVTGSSVLCGARRV